MGWSIHKFKIVNDHKAIICPIPVDGVMVTSKEEVWQPCVCGHSRMIHGDVSFMDALGSCFETNGKGKCECGKFKPNANPVQ